MQQRLMGEHSGTSECTDTGAWVHETALRCANLKEISALDQFRHVREHVFDTAHRSAVGRGEEEAVADLLVDAQTRSVGQRPAG